MKRPPKLVRICVLLVLSGILDGCWRAHRELQTLSIPDSDRITALSIDDNFRKVSEPRTIDDPTTIAEFMAFIDALCKRWERPMGQLPPAQYRVFLQGSYPGNYPPSILSGQVVISLGNDWLAATESWEHSGATRMLTLSGEEMATAHRLLGLEP